MNSTYFISNATELLKSIVHCQSQMPAHFVFLDSSLETYRQAIIDNCEWIIEIDTLYRSSELLGRIRRRKALSFFRSRFFNNLLVISGSIQNVEEKIKNSRCVYIFSDASPIVIYFLNRFESKMIEDGVACYRPLTKNRRFMRSVLKIWPRYGRHPNISEILVRNPELLP